MNCTTYHFAKPAQGHKHYLRPQLVTQLQQYGPDGRLNEVLELVYANWWAARASSRLRAFLPSRAPAPAFFLSREPVAAPEAAGAGLCGSVVVVGGGSGHAGDVGEGPDATLCCGALSTVFLRNGESLYRLVGTGHRGGAAWTWAPRKQGTSEVGKPSSPSPMEEYAPRVSKRHASARTKLADPKLFLRWSSS